MAPFITHSIALLVSLTLAYLAGFIGSIYTMPAIDSWYTNLVKPTLNPPSYVFGPVWTILYTFMAIAAWRVWLKRELFPSTWGTLRFYLEHLVVNGFWSYAFFGLKNPALALGVIVLLLFMVGSLMLRFRFIDRVAGMLFVPYFLWVLFATYLNLMIVILN